MKLIGLAIPLMSTFPPGQDTHTQPPQTADEEGQGQPNSLPFTASDVAGEQDMDMNLLIIDVVSSRS